jgi:hypothetical protein
MDDDMTTVDININNANGTSIGDWTGWIDFGQTEGGTAINDIYYDLDLDATTVNGVSLNIETPTLVEVGAMFPGASYAGAAMGTMLTSVQYPFFQWQNTETGASLGNGVEPGTPVTFRVYGQGMNGQPGEVLAEKVVPYAQINQEDWTVATFDTPVDLTGFNVWVTVEFTQAVGGYAMAFDGMSYQPNSGYYRTNGGGAFNTLGPDNLSEDYGCLHLRANIQGTPVPATWATLSKPEGSIAIGQTDVVTVNFNSIGMDDQTNLEAKVVFKTNDPDNEEYLIPIHLLVDYTSVAENGKEAYEIYPNPATSMVTLEGENLSHVAIYNVAGQLVRVVKLDSMVNNIEMNVEAGVYFFSIYDNNGNNNVQRVVISK